MQVIIISECTKRALKETRRILDQFAERRGERTWQTTITWEGLRTLRRLLRRTARKNTAVACHWVRGANQTELLWTVGRSQHFNERGAVPTDTSGREILRLSDENDWHTGEIIYLLASFAALIHDLGKACDAFQMRLNNKENHEGTNIYRHEWVSLRLFPAFVGQDSDTEWLTKILDSGGGAHSDWLSKVEADGFVSTINPPFETMSPLAVAIGWLVTSHHRLPDTYLKGRALRARDFSQYFFKIRAENNQAIFNDPTRKDVEPYWSFSEGLPVVNQDWQKRARRLARRLLDVLKKQPNLELLNNLYVMHLSRLCLMLADHHYSSQVHVSDRIQCKAVTSLYANKAFGKLNQTLEEHLIGVAVEAGYITHSMPSLETSLPTLANHRGLRKRTQIARFRWQDKAFDLVSSIRDKARHKGAFFVNMASTGCGKTLANARIMYALADPEKGARFSIALGLRTLTLQTGQAYRAQRMHLDEDQLAIRVGGSASRDLFEFFRQRAEESGSESLQDLIDEDGGVLFEGDYDSHPLLSRTLHNRNVKALVAAPVLVSTIDHLTPATEGIRGGRQIAPMLRLMTSDLVLDEIDDYGLEDLPALMRLVHWAGLLGSRVMLSSATLPPALVQGLFSAYLAGRAQYQTNRGHDRSGVDVCSAWFDEYGCIHADCATEANFLAQHNIFAERREERLRKKVKAKEVQRTGSIVPIDISSEEKNGFFGRFAETLMNNALELHNNNFIKDPETNKNVSFGLIRMANIIPLVHIALEFFKLNLPERYRIHLCVYHSQFPLIMRSIIEKELDRSLERNSPHAVLDLPIVRRKLDRYWEKNQLFIVLGSPVTEVGRDHDYDWAIIEPSSMRSIIQLVGRVRRHRPKSWDQVNVNILSRNVRSFRLSDKPAFQRPGFEDDSVRLISKDVSELLHEDESTYIDSRPRILAREHLDPTRSLVDLEHFQLEKKMLPSTIRRSPRRRRSGSNRNGDLTYRLGAHSWWTAECSTLMALLQKHYPFRHDKQPRENYVLLINEDEDDFVFCRIDQTSSREEVYIPVEETQLKRVTENILSSKRIIPWFEKNYMELIAEQADAEEIDIYDCAKKYGTITLP